MELTLLVQTPVLRGMRPDFRRYTHRVGAVVGNAIALPLRHEQVFSVAW
jgi:hypothetical protein